MTVPSVVTDEPWCEDDPKDLQHRVDQREIRPAELVSKEAVDGEHVREDDPVGFAVVEAERRETTAGAEPNRSLEVTMFDAKPREPGRTEGPAGSRPETPATLRACRRRVRSRRRVMVALVGIQPVIAQSTQIEWMTRSPCPRVSLTPFLSR